MISHRTFRLFILLSLNFMMILPSFAETVNFTPPNSNNPASVVANLPISQIGCLKLNQGMAHLDNYLISIGAVPDWLFDEHKVLSGFILNSHMIISGNEAFISGTAYFYKGEWLSYLTNTTNLDLITLTNQGLIRGRIVAFNPPKMDIQLDNGQIKTYASDEIKSISSVKCFSFSIPTKIPKINPTDNSLEGQAYKISFTPSQRNVSFFASISNNAITPKSTLAGTEGQISKKFIAALIGMDIAVDLAPFIAIPATFGPTTQYARAKGILNSANNVSNYESQQSTIQLIQQYAVLKP